MRRLIIFNQLSADGFFADEHGDMSWAHTNDAETNAFAGENASGNGELLFGRKTYDMMAAFWPTPAAKQVNAKVAEGMNRMPKVVVSRSLDKAPWGNTRVVKANLIEEVQRMKQAPGGDIVVMGSGSVCSQLAQAGLVDEYQLMQIPLFLGKGRPLFEGVERRIPLKLLKSRTFQNGNAFLVYAPA